MVDFPIVGIGASAGGLEALDKLFAKLPPDTARRVRRRRPPRSHAREPSQRTAQPAHQDADRDRRRRHQDRAQPRLRHRARLPKRRRIAGLGVEREFASLGRRTMLLHARPLDTVDLILLAIQDITEHKRAERALAEELQAMTRLHELTKRLVGATDLQRLLDEILDATIQLHGADFGNIWRYDAATKTLRIAAQRGFDQRFLDRFASVDVQNNSACGLALARRERVVIEDIRQDPTRAADRHEARAAGYRSVQATPLFTRSGEPLGMLSTHFRQPHRFSPRELNLTDVYARLAADAIAAQLLQESLRASESGCARCWTPRRSGCCSSICRAR